MNKQQMAERAIVAARAQGCTCNPDIEFIKTKRSYPECNIRHDDDCALLSAVRKGNVGRDQAILFRH